MAMKKNEKGVFACGWYGCDKTYAYYEGLRRHVKRTHESEGLRCPQCGYSKFDDEKAFETHVARHFEKKSRR
jgi:uncharacterized C2H2 Zn-finger protein